MSQQMPKPMIIVIAPFCIAAGFLIVLVREIGRAFKYAYLEARIEFDAAKRAYAQGSDANG